MITRLHCVCGKLIKEAITFIAICIAGFVRIKNNYRRFFIYVNLVLVFYMLLFVFSHDKFGLFDKIPQNLDERK